MDRIRQQADAAIEAYRLEIEEWPAVQTNIVMSRERLSSFIALGAPPIIIENEIKLLLKRVYKLKQARLGAMVH